MTPPKDDLPQFLVKCGVVLIIASLTTAVLSNCKVTITWEKPKPVEARS